MQKNSRSFFEVLMSRNIITFVFLGMLTSITVAEGNLAVTKTVRIDAPAPAVWKKIRDFNALQSWHPAVAKDVIEEGENNSAGAVRLLTLGDGGTIREKLLAWDDAGMSQTYNIIEGVLPVRDYVATLKVERLTDTSSKVTWSGSFSAAAGTDDQKASDTISGIYEAGLDNLSRILATTNSNP